MNPKKAGDSNRLFIRVVKFSTAFSLGLMAAFLHSLRELNPSLRFEVSWVTALWFAVGAAFSRFFWKLLPLESGGQADAGGSPDGKAARAVVLTLVMAGGLVAGFVYALKDVAREKVPEFVIGTTLALVFLGAAGGLIYSVGRYFDSEG